MKIILYIYQIQHILVLSCFLCSIPSIILSALEKSPIPFMSFIGVSVIHCTLLGLPLYIVLDFLKLINSKTCIASGFLIATLPQVLFFMHRSSGPGVDHPKTLILFMIYGAAIGYFFHVFLKKQKPSIASLSPFSHKENYSAENKPVIKISKKRSEHFDPQDSWQLDLALQDFRSGSPLHYFCPSCKSKITISRIDTALRNYVSSCECCRCNRILRYQE